eukprot:scaffold360_cov192-Amphora_coffeaeformis.AAC.6
MSWSIVKREANQEAIDGEMICVMVTVVVDAVMWGLTHTALFDDLLFFLFTVTFCAVADPEN